MNGEAPQTSAQMSRMGAGTQLTSSLLSRMVYCKPVLLMNIGSFYVTALMLVLQRKAVSTLPLSF